MMDNIARMKVEELRSKRERCLRIVNGLKGNAEFQEVINDLKSMSEKVDSCWHLIPENGDWASKIREARITKLATEYVIGILRTYENDANQAEKEIMQLENPNLIISKDVDNE